MNRFLVTAAAIALLISAPSVCGTYSYATSEPPVKDQKAVTLSALDQVRNFVFDVGDKISRFQGKKFVLILRFTKTTRKPDCQIVFTKRENDQMEVLIERVPRPVSAYFPDDISEDSLTRDQLKAIASQIPMERRLLRQAPNNLENLVSQFFQLKMSPVSEQDLPLDGTQYDLWYAVPQQTIHITQHGPTVGFGGGTIQPTKWMNDVYNALEQNDSAQVKPHK